MLTYILFHDPTGPNGYLSNWYMSPFEINGKIYCCAEQYMMEQKALLFSDVEQAVRIMETKDPAEMQRLGRGISGFEEAAWNDCKGEIVAQALLAKFSQNRELGDALLATGESRIVECSRSDEVWGIGRGIDDPLVAEPASWRGSNLLGAVLETVRYHLRKDHCLAVGGTESLWTCPAAR